MAAWAVFLISLQVQGKPPSYSKCTSLLPYFKLRPQFQESLYDPNSANNTEMHDPGNAG